MADIDTKLAGKEAEYETLTRATAGLLEQHEKLRKDFDKELAEKEKVSESELRKKLKSKRKTLLDLESGIAKGNKELEKLGETTANEVRTHTEAIRGLTREKAIIEESVTTLKREKLSLQSENTVLKGENASLIEDITKSRDALFQAEAKVSESSDKLSVVNLNLEEAQVNYDFKKAELENELKSTNVKLGQVNSQLDAASKSLHQVKLEEDNIRTDLADWSLKLDKREQAINGREAKVAQQEKRIFNYSKFTGL